MRLISSSLLAGVLALGAISPAFADQPGRGRGHDDRGRNDRDHRNDRNDRNDRNWGNNNRGNDHWNGRGWWSGNDHHDWRRGDRFDRGFYRTRFVAVNNYRDYRLPPPRYGEYYTRDNNTGEILLIAAATGLVLWALNN